MEYNFRINSAKVSDVSSLDHAGLTVKMNCTRIPVIISDIEDTAIDILGEEVFAGIRSVEMLALPKESFMYISSFIKKPTFYLL